MFICFLGFYIETFFQSQDCYVLHALETVRTFSFSAESWEPDMQTYTTILPLLGS
jgi:hypothetical protein